MILKHGLCVLNPSTAAPQKVRTGWGFQTALGSGTKEIKKSHDARTRGAHSRFRAKLTVRGANAGGHDDVRLLETRQPKVDDLSTEARTSHSGSAGSGEDEVYFTKLDLKAVFGRHRFRNREVGGVHEDYRFRETLPSRHPYT